MRTRWSQDEIAIEILRRYAVNEPLSYGEVQKCDLRLLRAATRYFGSWQAAIEYAGLDYEAIRRYRVWTPERIVEQLLAYHQKGESLSWRHVSTRLNPALAAAAIRINRFGSWDAALRAAGLDSDEIRRHRRWESPALLAELKRMQAAGESLRVSDVAERAPSLVAAVRRRFGGWYDAVQAAGLDEWEARLGTDGRYDRDEARGQVSWSALNHSAIDHTEPWK